MRRWAIVFGIAALLCVGLGWLDSSQQQPITSSQQTEPAKTSHEHDSAVRGASFWQTTDSFIRSYKDEIDTASTVVIALFTGILGIWTVRLWAATRSLVKGAEDTARRQLRAYISVEPRGIDEYRGHDEAVGHFRIRNTGKIPAQNLLVFAKIASDSRHDRRAFDPGSPRAAATTLQPRAKMDVGSDRLKWSDIGNADGPLTKQGFLYVWGAVTYTDEFGTSGRTNFCHRYPCQMFGEGGGGFYRISRKVARYHEEGDNTAS